jgi:hypothetical protein
MMQQENSLPYRSTVQRPPATLRPTDVQGSRGADWATRR